MTKSDLISLLQVPKGMPALHPAVYEHGKQCVAALAEKLSDNKLSDGKPSDDNNRLSFAEYMQFCLYEPGLGYYVSGLQKFGVDGDFVTAPELSSIFGECYAAALASSLKEHPEWSILELGPGRGKLASSLLGYLKKLDALPTSYQLLEVSPSLKQVQKDELAFLSQDIDIQWLDKPPQGFKGIVIANEVIDALSVERFRVNNNQVLQLGVTLKDNKLVWFNKPADEYLSQQVKALGPLPNAYESEICLQLKFWLQSVTQGMREGVLLFSDYGFSQAEYYSEERQQGTLRCHYRHYAHNDPLLLPGLQDITAWVNFTLLAEAAHELGLDVMGYSTQAHFMLGGGRLQKIDYSELSDAETIKLNQEIKQLTLPSGMGEQFRFMQLNKNCDVSLPAMRVRDLRYQL